MKELVLAILEDSENTRLLFQELNRLGYNGTTVATSSITRKLLEDGDYTPIIGNLRQMTGQHYESTTTIFVILEHEKVEGLKNVIRNYTKNFTVNRGGMAVLPLTSFEGSF